MIAEDALTGKDPLDQYAPRGLSTRLGLSIEPPIEAVYGDFSLDARPLTGEGEAFDLVLRAKADEKILVSMEGLAAFENWDVFLVDRLTGRFADLHAQPEITVYPRTNTSKYTILVGSPGYIASQGTELAPRELALTQNYPNPFSTSTTIEYSLPEAQQVELVVYQISKNSLGFPLLFFSIQLN
jgi:hypothetical protein